MESNKEEEDEGFRVVCLHGYEEGFGLCAWTEMKKLVDLVRTLSLSSEYATYKPVSEHAHISQSENMPHISQSSELGTYKPVKARFCPWFSGKSP